MITEEANREEFFNETQELIEGFSRSLLGIDAGLTEGLSHPELLNEAFRTIHTLKGLAGLFGAHALGALTHDLEDLLDGVRLGTIDITSEVLDVLFGTVEASHQLLRAERETPGIQVADVEGISQITAAISKLAHRP